MEELNTPIFAQAKVEYTKQLIEILYPHMFDGIKSIYDESKVIYSSKTGTPIFVSLEWEVGCRRWQVGVTGMAGRSRIGRGRGQALFVQVPGHHRREVKNGRRGGRGQ